MITLYRAASDVDLQMMPEPFGSIAAWLAACGVTPRQREVLLLVGARLSNAEIATKLVVSKRTVESHVSALLSKLQASNRRVLAQVGGGLEEELAANLSAGMLSHRTSAAPTVPTESRLWIRQARDFAAERRALRRRAKRRWETGTALRNGTRRHIQASQQALQRSRSLLNETAPVRRSNDCTPVART